jgi:hypothetical protein
MKYQLLGRDQESDGEEACQEPLSIGKIAS